MHVRCSSPNVISRPADISYVSLALTSGYIALNVKNQQRVVQTLPKEQPTPATLSFLYIDSPALMVDWLQRPALCPSSPSCYPVMELLQHLATNGLEVWVLQAVTPQNTAQCWGQGQALYTSTVINPALATAPRPMQPSGALPVSKLMASAKHCHKRVQHLHSSNSKLYCLVPTLTLTMLVYCCCLLSHPDVDPVFCFFLWLWQV